MKNQEKIMLEKIQEYRAGKRTLAAFCFKEGITIDKMKYWMYHRKLEHKPIVSDIPASGTKGFVSINIIEDNKTGPGLRLEVRGITITIERGFDKALLLEVAEALTA